ncbi:unnamed protein product [Ambrosiozyma monospora]|uniref:Unnamed protein product n=1 Tax=Ambrosiozyma monospora TaxID=43982 RepID=A0ACB5U8L6_AMBMO|nr:unnamed protein product [Ambrosiozyma monospora]
MKNGTNTPILRPYTSDNGANTMGPNAIPRMYSDVAISDTSRDMPNCLCSFCITRLEDIVVELNCAANVMKPYSAVWMSFLKRDQFLGLRFDVGWSSISWFRSSWIMMSLYGLGLELGLSLLELVGELELESWLWIELSSNPPFSISSKLLSFSVVKRALSSFFNFIILNFLC